MALASSNVATGQQILAAHHNQLRADVTTNHTHASGEGGTVDHADLADTGNMSGFNHNHTDLDIHLNGSGPGGNSIDNPGGVQGVHGLATASYVAGSLGYMSGAAFTAGQLVFEAGYQAVSSTSGTVTFGSAFSTIVCVVTTPHASIDMNDRDVYVTAYNTNSFSWECAYQPTGFGWIAVGLKT